MSAPKMVLYSGHDSTVYSILAALGASLSPKLRGIPPYTSHVSFELYSKETNPSRQPENAQSEQEGNNGHGETYFISIRYNGQNLELPKCGHATFCPLMQFVDMLASVTPASTMTWNAECKNEFANLGPASAAGFLGVDWEEWPGISVVLVICLLIENAFGLAIATRAKKCTAGVVLFLIALVTTATVVVLLITEGVDWEEWPDIAYGLSAMLVVENIIVLSVWTCCSVLAVCLLSVHSCAKLQ